MIELVGQGIALAVVGGVIVSGLYGLTRDYWI
jgi:hypothetical protein